MIHHSGYGELSRLVHTGGDAHRNVVALDTGVKGGHLDAACSIRAPNRCSRLLRTLRREAVQQHLFGRTGNVGALEHFAEEQRARFGDCAAGKRTGVLPRLNDGHLPHRAPGEGLRDSRRAAGTDGCRRRPPALEIDVNSGPHLVLRGPRPACHQRTPPLKN